ncbi:hypothetical protein [Piscinibacter koreensis]|nr:hypothetical protein [Schlegelella koreensis]
MATHYWWHMALFHLARGEASLALDLYDLASVPRTAECDNLG